MKIKKSVFVAVACLGVGALAGAQLMQLIKVIGVAAAVKQFAPQINKEFNKLENHTDTRSEFTKVVPILRVGIGGGGTAIGAAQVMGPKSQVEKVQAVAQPEAKIFGEIGIRALIPVSTKSLTDIKKVDGVGVTGIVDLKV